MRQILFVFVALIGLGVLLSLGFWQLQRLSWKEGLIAQADAMMLQEPVALPAALDPVKDRYRPVYAQGRFTGEETYVLTSKREWGAGFLIISAFETEDGRRILIDRGFVPEAAKAVIRQKVEARIVGNLNWPDDMTPSTPAYDAKAEIWFGRDLVNIAKLLGTEPVMIIAREETGDGITPMPASAQFKNDHLGYALTWFGLAFVWAGMTLAWLLRIRRRKV